MTITLQRSPRILRSYAFLSLNKIDRAAFVGLRSSSKLYTKFYVKFYANLYANPIGIDRARSTRFYAIQPKSIARILRDSYGPPTEAETRAIAALDFLHAHILNSVNTVAIAAAKNRGKESSIHFLNAAYASL